MSDARLDRWLEELVSTPGLTGIREVGEARRTLLDGSLAAVPHVRRFPGPIIDVGSGGGAPGVPLAVALPEREVVLLESSERKCRFLEQVTAGLPNVRVVRGRAEEQPSDRYGAVVARALAPPPISAEWCLPLARPGGAVVLFVGAAVDVEAVARVADQIGGGRPQADRGLLVIPKLSLTPAGFPRRTGMARKRPL